MAARKNEKRVTSPHTSSADCIPVAPPTLAAHRNENVLFKCAFRVDDRDLVRTATGGEGASAPADNLVDVVSAAGEEPSVETKSRENVADQPPEGGVGATPGAVETRSPPVTEGDIAGWRPEENMRLSEIHLARDAT